MSSNFQTPPFNNKTCAFPLDNASKNIAFPPPSPHYFETLGGSLLLKGFHQSSQNALFNLTLIHFFNLCPDSPKQTIIPAKPVCPLSLGKWHNYACLSSHWFDNRRDLPLTNLCLSNLTQSLEPHLPTSLLTNTAFQ